MTRSNTEQVGQGQNFSSFVMVTDAQRNVAPEAPKDVRNLDFNLNSYASTSVSQSIS